MAKKLVLVICEGQSDKTALKQCINKLLEQKGVTAEIGCEVYGGDFLFHDFKNKEAFSDPLTVMDRIVASINDFIKKSQTSERYKWSDFIAVATLSDLDACYCKDDDILHNDSFSTPKTFYDFQNKKIITNDVSFIQKRNERKRNALGILFNESLVAPSPNKKFVPFRAFYFNTNLEHVFYQKEGVYDSDEKNNFARNFAKKYRNAPLEFLDFLQSLPTLSKNGDYFTTWNERELKIMHFRV